MKKFFRAFGYPASVWFPKSEYNFLAFICVSFAIAMFVSPYPQYAMWAGFLFAAYAAAYAANKKPAHIAYCGYGDTNIAIAKETHMNARKLYSLLGNHTEAGYPNARKNFFM